MTSCRRHFAIAAISFTDFREDPRRQPSVYWRVIDLTELMRDMGSA